MKMLIEILWQLEVFINYDSQIILIEMATGTKPPGLGFSDHTHRRKILPRVIYLVSRVEILS
jgi:hypothetical protein